MKLFPRLFIAAAAMTLLCAWSPPVPILDGRIRMFFESDLRDTHLTPKIVAAACVRHRSGQVHYELGKDNSFFIICRVPKLPTVDAHTVRFHVLVSSRANAHGEFINALARIDILAPTKSRNWIALNVVEKNTMIKDIRDLALDDGSIPDIAEGQDAFGYWRWCQSANDSNCYPKDSY